MAARGPNHIDPSSSSSDLGPLPGGHHGLSREQVVESQRERLLSALALTAAVNGYRGTTITEILKAASVSSRDFYENFDSKEACFLAAFDAVVDHLRQLITEAAEPVPDWPGRVVVALRTLLDFLVAEPDLARLCLVEPFAAGPTIATHFCEVVVAIVPSLQTGRAERPEAAALPESTEDSLLGGLIALTVRSLLTGEPGSLPRQLPNLVDFALSPYLGPTRARQLAREAAAFS